jgi:hypothetical protein
MMSELLAFMELGFRHIVDVSAMDHILFLLALAAIYRWRDWRDALWVVSAFTVGHSTTLVLAVTGTLTISSQLVEFLIPLTIVAACAENLMVRDRARAPWGGRYRAVLAALFGLVHGAGFATYLRSLFVDHIAVPLFGFNIGIEAGQIVVLACAATLLTLVDASLRRMHLPRGAPAPLRLRVVAISTVVMIVAGAWAIQRNPWSGS